MGGKREAQGKRSILIANSLKFALLTKRILNLSRCKHSVLFEFNCTLTEDGLTPISVGTFHNWLKQHRPYIGICPSMSHYCNKCKEFEEIITVPTNY